LIGQYSASSAKRVSMPACPPKLAFFNERRWEANLTGRPTGLVDDRSGQLAPSSEPRDSGPAGVAGGLAVI
jgi:hypothetical protein